MPPCVQSAAFRVDAGSLVLVGPAPLEQHRTCVSGQTCSLDGLSGYHLSESDSFLVLDTCGSTIALVPRFSDATSSVSVRVSGSKVEITDS